LPKAKANLREMTLARRRWLGAILLGVTQLGRYPVVTLYLSRLFFLAGEVTCGRRPGVSVFISKYATRGWSAF